MKLACALLLVCFPPSSYAVLYFTSADIPLNARIKKRETVLVPHQTKTEYHMQTNVPTIKWVVSKVLRSNGNACHSHRIDILNGRQRTPLIAHALTPDEENQLQGLFNKAELVYKLQKASQ